MKNNKQDIIIATDSMELTFDTDVRHLAIPAYQQAEQIANNIIQKTEELQDPYYAFEAIRQFDTLRNMVGIAKAKVLWYLNKTWASYQIQTPFLEAIVAYSGLTNVDVVKRYIKIWEIFENGQVPTEFADQLKAKPINELTPVMGALQAGYEFKQDDWQAIIERKGNPAISAYIRDNIKETEPRSQAINYHLTKEGILYAVTSGKTYRIGRLILTVQEHAAKRAIMRLVETMNIHTEDEENETDNSGQNESN